VSGAIPASEGYECGATSSMGEPHARQAEKALEQPREEPRRLGRAVKFTDDECQLMLCARLREEEIQRASGPGQQIVSDSSIWYRPERAGEHGPPFPGPSYLAGGLWAWIRQRPRPPSISTQDSSPCRFTCTNRHRLSAAPRQPMPRLVCQMRHGQARVHTTIGEIYNLRSGRP
jgi:hypothetical protein